MCIIQILIDHNNDVKYSIDDEIYMMSENLEDIAISHSDMDILTSLTGDLGLSGYEYIKCDNSQLFKVLYFSEKLITIENENGSYMSGKIVSYTENHDHCRKLQTLAMVFGYRQMTASEFLIDLEIN